DRRSSRCVLLHAAPATLPRSLPASPPPPSAALDSRHPSLASGPAPAAPCGPPSRSPSAADSPASRTAPAPCTPASSAADAHATPCCSRPVLWRSPHRPPAACLRRLLHPRVPSPHTLAPLRAAAVLPLPLPTRCGSRAPSP